MIISSDSEDEPHVHRKLRLKGKDLNPSHGPSSHLVKITRQLKVTGIEEIQKIPCCWPIKEKVVAYVLDLSSNVCQWLDDDKEPVIMEAIIQVHVSGYVV